jgi:hypothetical protein
MTVLAEPMRVFERGVRHIQLPGRAIHLNDELSQRIAPRSSTPSLASPMR